MARAAHGPSRRSIPEVLADPAASFALKAVLIVWRDRDPVDAAGDARLLADLLEARCVRRLEPAR